MRDDRFHTIQLAGSQSLESITHRLALLVCPLEKRAIAQAYHRQFHQLVAYFQLVQRVAATGQSVDDSGDREADDLSDVQPITQFLEQGESSWDRV